jgi:NAD(P)-dependent dehydrogenase (short-subunit alcohol dehydrogenase family)
MDSKICMVTGATSGIGFETALGLAKQGAEVVLVGRNAERGARAVDRIRADTINGRLNFLKADLSSQGQIRQLADRFKDEYDRLDVLINNAGGFFLTRELSPDGIEMTFALNHLAYFLLTHLLLDVLKESAPARVINVASGAHHGAQIQFDDLGGEKGYRGWRAYAQSKLANLLFTFELARRIEDTGVTANALHPGFVATNLGKNSGWVARLVLWFLHLRAFSPAQGAGTSIYLASSSEVEGDNGAYFVNKKIVEPDPAARDKLSAQRLWTVSEKMVGLGS